MIDPCLCCASRIGHLEEQYVAGQWEGRLTGYCLDCATARCDAYPGECPRKN